MTEDEKAAAEVAAAKAKAAADAKAKADAKRARCGAARTAAQERRAQPGARASQPAGGVVIGPHLAQRVWDDSMNCPRPYDRSPSLAVATTAVDPRDRTPK